jgi:hypothetical protein
MQNLQKIILFIIITTGTLLKGMVHISQKELQKARTPVPSLQVRDIDNIPAMCAELAMRCYEQPTAVQASFYSLKDLPLADINDARIMGIITEGAKTLDTRAWYINDTGWNMSSLSTYSENGLRLHMSANAGKRYCTISELGRLYEKVIAAVQSGWSFPTIQTYHHGMGSMNKHEKAYLFIKDVSLFLRHPLYGEDTLIRFLNVKLKGHSMYCGGPDHYDSWLPEDHPHRRTIRLLIRKDAFKEVQEKLKFNLPSQEELEQKLAEI